MALSVVQTFVMMVGEMNYQNNFLDPYLRGELPFALLTYLVFVQFVLLMPILLVNLMVSMLLQPVVSVLINPLQTHTKVSSCYF